jgi:hypothetical protein
MVTVGQNHSSKLMSSRSVFSTTWRSRSRTGKFHQNTPPFNWRLLQSLWNPHSHIVPNHSREGHFRGFERCTHDTIFYRIDILVSISGVEFSECFPGQVDVALDGVVVNFIDLEHLKLNKKASKRLQDLADLENLDKVNYHPFDP